MKKSDAPGLILFVILLAGLTIVLFFAQRMYTPKCHYYALLFVISLFGAAFNPIFDEKKREIDRLADQDITTKQLKFIIFRTLYFFFLSCVVFLGVSEVDGGVTASGFLIAAGVASVGIAK